MPPKLLNLTLIPIVPAHAELLTSLEPRMMNSETGPHTLTHTNTWTLFLCCDQATTFLFFSSIYYRLQYK